MHILQPKHTKLRQNEVKELLQKLNISITQLPKIIKTDAALPEDSKSGDVIKIERKSDDGKSVYYRVIA